MTAQHAYAQLGALSINDSWGENAACKDLDKALILEDPDRETEAKALCLGSRIDGTPRCPVIDECALWVLPLRRHKDPGGVRAGMNEVERNRARRRRPPAPKVTATTRRCPACKTPKSASEFYLNASHADGLSTQCRVCISARDKRARKDRKAVGQ